MSTCRHDIRHASGNHAKLRSRRAGIERAGHAAAGILGNLVGDQADSWHELLAEPGACLHLYGKDEARPGRKMGHVTRITPED